ncbi:uncharacterized protein LOC131146372 [Malania oleifera]|uniref:uncharacterized protein LOC131146372 n=1 Tax=Malania oleifera TaxID=397392 RepID=UPI0025AE1866|nr:uncharacterized protein LOC131146372 [Malania oleifera]XP_057951941.1 uncharacterized protein LOC131146372 [Malania oleifera]
MLQPHQSSYPSLLSYSDQSHALAPIPIVSYPQIPLFSVLPSDPCLHAPGTDPHASSSSYLSVSAAQTSLYHHDPVAVSESWVVKQADPVKYAADHKSLIKKSIGPTSSNSLGNSDCMNEPLANDASKNTTKQTQVSQPLRCEICKIDCTSKDVFEKHMLGKKHKKKLQMEIAHTPFNKRSRPGLGYVEWISGASGVAIGEDLEAKKRKVLNGGAQSDSVKVCTICNVVCNSQEVFNKHISGKKHAIQAGLIPAITAQPFVAANANTNPLCWIVPRVQPQSSWVQKNIRKKTKIVQSAWCEVCRLQCNSIDVFNRHIMGKRHQKNLEQLEASKQDTSGATTTEANSVSGPAENPEAGQCKPSDMAKSVNKTNLSQASEIDLEVKKRKVLEGGAAAGAVRVCTLCNVVCNSQTVFNFHLTGQKHAAMVQKLADTAMAKAGAQGSACV